MNTKLLPKQRLHRMHTNILSIIVILAMAFPVMGSTYAQVPSPYFRAFPDGNAVDGGNWPLGATVHMAIDDPATTKIAPDYEQDATVIVSPWDWISTYVRFDFDGLYDLKRGDKVTLTTSEISRYQVVPNLRVTEVDPETNVIGGTFSGAEAGTQVHVFSGGAAELFVAVDSASTWVADFDTIGFDLRPGISSGAEVWFDEFGDSTIFDWNVPLPSPWREEFDGSLADDWYWVHENPNEWNLTENPGFLRIYTSPSPAGGENLLLRPVAQGDFVIETRLFFEPDSNFQAAGLFIHQDNANTLWFGRAFCDIPDVCVGNGIYFDYIAGGNWTGSNFATSVDSPNEAWLRLERRGEMVRAFYSYEGITWFEIGTHWIPPDFQVNGVGLLASGDSSDANIPADFDFFELTEGWGFLPEGFHDYDQGNVPDSACGAGGWAADPDDRATDLAIEVSVDGTSLPEWLYASEYREDLDDAGVCVDGKCSFSTSLWGTISSYEPHSVVVYAQDIPSGEWVQLSNSPKTLTCRTFDIYTFDPNTGQTRQVTNLRESGEYNPSWSPNGKFVAHDVVLGDSHDIYVTHVSTRKSVPLKGADSGNDAAWSPNGRWIAFDRRWVNDPSIYVVPFTGGQRRLVRENAVSADWSPNGLRIVFQDLSDGGKVKTVGPLGNLVIKVADYGESPAWSPDGKWIAFHKDGDIWKLRVGPLGTPLGEPIPVTSSSLVEGHPTWSADSKTIVFHSGLSSDYDIWTVPAAGGTPTWLNGAPAAGEYDPDYAGNSSNIAYASFSPEGQAARDWISVYTFDVGTWSEGTHTYHFEAEWNGGSDTGPDVSFTVSNGQTPAYEGYVLLGYANLQASTVDGTCQIIDTIPPNQPTRLTVHYQASNVPYTDAVASFNNLSAEAVWDSGMSTTLVRHEIIPFTPQLDLGSYLCTFTR